MLKINFKKYKNIILIYFNKIIIIIITILLNNPTYWLKKQKKEQRRRELLLFLLPLFNYDQVIFKLAFQTVSGATFHSIFCKL